jgi:hypothetical protein
MTCSTQNKKENIAQVSSILDTLNYEKKDYDSMREYFNTDTLFQSKLSKGIEVGDTSAIKIKNLLTTEYESRDKTGMTEPEIDIIIFSFYAAKEVRGKFNEIESRLRKAVGDPDAAKRKTDSLINRMDKLKQEMKELVKEN